MKQKARFFHDRLKRMKINVFDICVSEISLLKLIIFH